MLDEQRLRVGPLAVWVHPSSSPARGRVILLHGQGEHSGRHRPTAAALVARGFEVVRFDFRGAGESEGARQWIERFDDYDEATHGYHELHLDTCRQSYFEIIGACAPDYDRRTSMSRSPANWYLGTPCPHDSLIRVRRDE